MRKRNHKRIVELHVTKLSDKGNGLGLFQQGEGSPVQVEIPFTAPQDHVKVQLLKKRVGVYQANLVELLSPSSERIAPRCEHFSRCGGCRLQHVSYEHQLQHKESYVRNCYQNILTPEVQFHPILPAAQPWNYRNKMDYTFSDKFGKQLGLIAHGKRKEVLDLKECHLANPWFLEAVKYVKEWWQAETPETQIENEIGELQLLTIREGQRTGDRMMILTVNSPPEFEVKANKLENFVAYLKEKLSPVDSQSTLSIYLRIQKIGKGVSTNLYEMLLHGPGYIREVLDVKVYDNKPSTSLNLEIGPSTFFQPNPKQTEIFYALALRMAEIPSDAIVYDLYCGGGTLGLSIAKHVKQVIGIELFPESALKAIANAKRNGLENVSIMSGAVHHVLNQIPAKKLPVPDIIFVNPPRSGLDAKTISHLIAINPKKILYVSCNPITQAKNVEELIKNGFRIKAIQPVDQFPHTYQVENVVILERK